MKTILFADDHKSIREYCREEFEEEGYRVLLARDGREALQLVRQEHPDMAVLDIYMPGGTGLEALEAIKRIAPAMPVVLFTAHDEACLRDQRSRLAAACVEKCADLTELKRLVCTLLTSQNGRAAVRVGLPPSRHMENSAC